MSLLRMFVPRGATVEEARLQVNVPGRRPGDAWWGWEDVPVVYEDPDDEVVDCPATTDKHMRDGLWAGQCCRLCLGHGRATRGDIARRQAQVAREAEEAKRGKRGKEAKR